MVEKWVVVCSLIHETMGAVSEPPPLPFSHRLIWEVWMPFVRNIVSQWQPRNCEPMVDFLDSWVHIIPVWILENILDQLIFPKLQKEVGPGPGSWESVGTRSALLFLPVLLKRLQLPSLSAQLLPSVNANPFHPKAPVNRNSFSWFLY